MNMDKLASKSSKNFISVDEVCKIIDTCRKRGVSKLEFGPLVLHFGALEHSSAPEQVISVKSKEKLQKEMVNAEKDAVTADEVALREEQMAELWITDPLRAEEMLSAGELTVSGEGDDG